MRPGDRRRRRVLRVVRSRARPGCRRSNRRPTTSTWTTRSRSRWRPRNRRSGAIVCTSCGGTQFEDGFCTTCGAKQPSWRDHFTESPSDLVAGVCDKGVGRNRNEDAMAMAVVGDRAVLVVCDGVTTAPDSDRASLAAARGRRDVLASAPTAPPGTAGSRGPLERAARQRLRGGEPRGRRRRPDTRQPARAAVVHVRRRRRGTNARRRGLVRRLARLLAARRRRRRSS